jgi:hypothetical protein
LRAAVSVAASSTTAGPPMDRASNDKRAPQRGRRR